jgi:hypothetical protein
MFDKNDFYVKTFGLPGDWKPVDAAVFENLLYVADPKNNEIRVFDIASGQEKNRIGASGDGSSILGIPTNIVFDSQGYLYVSDAGRFQVLKLDRDGNIRSAFGKLGNQAGTFARPRGVAVDRQNRLYAADAAFNNVQLFNADARLLLFFSKPGKKPGDLYLAAKVFVDYDNLKYFERYADPNFHVEYLIFVTSQFGDSMVNVYGFGTEKGRTYPRDEDLMKEIEKKMQKSLREQPETSGSPDKDGR